MKDTVFITYDFEEGMWVATMEGEVVATAVEFPSIEKKVKRIAESES